MRLGRRLLLPAIIATPLVLWLTAVPFRGFGVLAELDWLFRPMDWLWVFLLTLLGISAIVLPVSTVIQSFQIPTAGKSGALVVAGAVGGGLVAILIFFLLALLSGDARDVASSPDALGVAPYGFLPGAIGAAVWAALNFRSLNPSTKRNG